MRGRREELRLEIEATIRRFEPRFLSVRVQLIEAQDRLDTTLRLRIEAVLHAEPAPESVTFDTLVDPTTTMSWYGQAMWCEPRPLRHDGEGAARSHVVMSDTLLPYYERELDAIKRLAAEFADAHPKIAGRLRLSADGVDDPHVARLLEGVAFLAARVHHRLDDEFPELTDALLGLLYPHYLAPMPSCMIAQFDCQPDLMDPARLPAGIAIDTEPVRGEALRYRTTIAGDAVAGRGGERPAVRPADRGARQPGRGRRRRRAAHHAEMRRRRT